MKIAVPKETKSFERRVALTPSVVKSIVKSGFTCIVESNAGEESYFSDASYEDAGAVIVYGAPQALAGADIVLMVNAPTSQEIQFMKDGSVLICHLYAYTVPNVIDALNKKKITAFSMDAVPRISRAQKMDALSSQANLAGYKSVLLGANALGRIFPLMMTAAGTITPSRVLVFGAGVAGLQAIATAKRLGAVVEATDVRPETREQVESLGGRFIQVEGVEGVKVEGGYALEVSTDYLQKQQELIKSRIKEADIAITTALVIGKKAPILITEEMVRSMKPGSVIVDMAVESGGNCALSVFGKTVVEHGVTIIGEPNLPSLLPVNASELYAKNISTLLLHLANSSGFRLDIEEEITKGSMITHDGELVHGFTKEILAKKNP